MFFTNASSYMSSRLSGSLSSRLAAVLWAIVVRLWRGRVRHIHDFGSHNLNNVRGTIVEIGELGSYGIANFFNSTNFDRSNYSEEEIANAGLGAKIL